jgi:Peptidase family M50
LLAFRKYLSWIHVFTALVCLRFAFGIFAALHSSRQVLSSHAAPYASMLVVFAGVFLTAWWMVLKARPSARAWSLVASSQFLFTALLPCLVTHRLHSVNIMLLGMAIMGYVAFGRRLKVKLAASVDPVRSIPGDFTNRYVNRFAQCVTFGLSLGAYLWWQGWLKAEHVTGLDSLLARSVLTLVVLLSITSIHETGHAIVGAICGMKVRAFFIGPFQWRIRDAKWQFEFKPKGLFLADGITALIPGNGELRPWQYLAMMAAGSLVNLLSGSLALYFAFHAGIAWSAPATGVIALFGAWSLGLAAANLLPFRTPQGYSDGAIVLQLLAGGPFAEFHLSVARIGASLVSALRPRDYDIGSIRAAARGIAQGRQALLMWLYAFSHSIDSGKTQEADDVLAHAELVCLQSAVNIPAELHTSFIFGNAIVRRDPKATRFWWNRMQAKHPTRFNADYWRAESALHWIEGNLDEANKAWEKSNALVKELPQAGAYDFSRHCCTLLKRELDLSSAA